MSIFSGWFAVTYKPRVEPVPHFCQVGVLASSDCDTILIGGERDVNALQVYKEGDLPQPRVLYPGDVLSVGNVHVTTTKAKKKMFKKSVSREEKFLRCTDYADREVLLPFEATGMFYALKQKRKTEIPIMHIKDIITDIKLPCIVKLVYGRFPITPCIFTGMLKLEECHKDPSVIVSSVFNLKNILLEIPVTIPLMFRVAITDKSLIASKGYNNALRQCQDEMETYMRNIKVSQGQTTGAQAQVKSPPLFSQAPPVDQCFTGRSSSSSKRDNDYIPVWIGPQTPTPPTSEGSGYPHSQPPQITKQNSITISTRNGYMTLPMYPRHTEVTDREQVISLVDKINLWQRMNTFDHNGSSPDSVDPATGASMPRRKASFTYSETGEITQGGDTIKHQATTKGPAIMSQNIQIMS